MSGQRPSERQRVGVDGAGEKTMRRQWLPLASVLFSLFSAWPVQAADCPASDPGPGYFRNGYKFVLTRKIYSPGTAMDHAVRQEFGPSARVADWEDLKAVLKTRRDSADFAASVGLEVQDSAFACRNYYITRNGRPDIGNMRYLLARHDGIRPHDWFIIEQLGGDYLHLGRWNHPAQIIVQVVDEERARDDRPGGPVAAKGKASGSPSGQVAQPSAKTPGAAPDDATRPSASTAIPENRIALVIGNSAYAAVGTLPNAKRDAETIAAALRSTAFKAVTVVTDANREQLVQALHAFSDQARTADWAVVYYAGHGIEFQGANYLIPTDARLRTDRDVEFEAVPLRQVLAAVEDARKLRLVVLDACRDNPFAERMRRTAATRSITRGLARVEPGGATLVAYAAKDGQVAEDGRGANSPFVSSLAKRLGEPGLEINMLFRLVRNDVLTATGQKQEPFTYGSLPPEPFYFRPPQAN
jgi:hypothetical protein